MKRIFITRRIFPEALMRLEKCGIDYEMNAGPPLDKQELMEKIEDVEGLMCLLSDRIDRAVLKAGPKLKIVANIAVGYDNIDVAAATERLCPSFPSGRGSW